MRIKHKRRHSINSSMKTNNKRHGTHTEDTCALSYQRHCSYSNHVSLLSLSLSFLPSSFLAELPLASIALVDVVCPRSGMAPIHKAIEKGWLDVVKLLIDKNANIEIECVLYDNERPLQLAKRFHFEQAVELLQEHAALATANKKTDTTTTI